MDPKKAIEIIKIEHKDIFLGSKTDYKNAIQLGIEALEWKLVLRKAKHPHGVKSLPSEKD